MPITEPPAVHSRRITSINVEGLFGHFSYSLGEPQLGDGDTNNLAILYGDNGSGKTTILRLVYHLLSKEDNRGHRSFLARTPFRKFAVSLGTHLVVTADRPEGNYLGSYRLRIVDDGAVVAEAHAPAADDGHVRMSDWPLEQRARWDYFIRELGALDIGLFYLTENRQESGPTRDFDHGDLSALQAEVLLAQRLMAQSPKARKEDPVSVAISAFENWVQSEALKGSTVGEANINNLYSDVARRIAHTGLRTSNEDKDSSGLLLEMARIEEESQPFATLGLLARPKLADLRQVLAQSHVTTQAIIASVVRPYIDSLNARLEALRPLHDVLQTFLDNANAFFANKQISFHVKSGLQIASIGGEALHPQMLSSGERQLLLLFCNTVSARNAATIVIIDEPEISLNVKWQRLLVDALLALVRGAPVQFVLATHSVELLAQHRDRVWRLPAHRIAR